jgi:hypothetical protein
VYAYNRPEITVETVPQVLDEFERVKLLFRWTDSAGRQWGYWVGIDKPGRLPGKSRQGKNEAIGAELPQEELARFIEKPTPDVSGLHTEANGIHTLPNGSNLLLGFGSGSGLGTGSGENSSSEAESTSDQEKNADSASIGAAKKKIKPSNEAEKLAALLQQEILRNKPDYRITPKQLRNWAATADRMMCLDQRSEESVARLIRWVQQDEFWMSNVLSMEKLREKFDQLEMRRNTSKGGGQSRQTSQHTSFEHIDYTAGREKNEDGTVRF